DELQISLFPNPFNPTTTLSFDLIHSCMVKLKVFDVIGRQVATLIDKNMTAGSHQVMFDGAGLTSGIYFARMTAGSKTMTQKMMLIR
ncbi:T9SS type A sorting domain-containing protein, partial [bacterium]|nr:T9SS type A sorting domain-containing protein [bacterium]